MNYTIEKHPSLIGQFEVFHEDQKIYDIELDTSSLLSQKLLLKKENERIGSCTQKGALVKEEYELILGNDTIGKITRKNTFFSHKMVFNDYELKSSWNDAGTKWEMIDQNGYEKMSFSQNGSFNDGKFVLTFKDETLEKTYLLVAMGLYLSIAKLNV